MDQYDGKHTVPFSANVWIASQALTRMSSSGELSSSTTVAGVLPSIGTGSNCECAERDVNTLNPFVPEMYTTVYTQAMGICFCGHGI